MCVFITYLCCLCDPLAGAERWVPGTLLLPLCLGHGRPGMCGCAGSGSSSCACCWWPHCPMGLTGGPAIHRWTGYPGPGRAEDSLECREYDCIIWIPKADGEQTGETASNLSTVRCRREMIPATHPDGNIVVLCQKTGSCYLTLLSII